MATREGCVLPLQETCELLIARQISLRTVLEWLELLKDDPILSHCEVLRSKCSTMASDAFEALCQMHGITKVQAALPEENFAALVNEAEARAHAKKQMQVRGTVVERKAVDSSFPKAAMVRSFSLQDLQEGVLWPPGMDPSRREAYLRDDDFASVFQMSRSEFSGLATWRQIQLKKKAGLF